MNRIVRGRFPGKFLIVTAFLVAILSGCGSNEEERGQGGSVAAAPSPPVGNPYLQDYNFTTDWFTHNIPVWEEIMAPYKGKPDIHYLEVGTYEGRSLIWMLENVLTDPSSRITGIDAFFDGPSWDVYSPDLLARFEANVKKAGGESKTTTIVGLSQEELRKLPLDSYDIIYIDGSHLGPDVLEDAILSFRLLKKGGMIVFDDYLWRPINPEWGWSDDPDMRGPKLAIDTFIRFFGPQIRVIHKGYQVAMVKDSG